MKIINIFSKVALVCLFAVALMYNIPNLEGKGMNLRAPFFLLGAFIVPLVFTITKKRRDYATKYPHKIDFLITLPFLLDTAGNFLGYFDSVTIFDDILHIVNWFLLILAFLELRKYSDKNSSDDFLLGIGMGTLLIVMWEITEWAISIDGFGIVSNLHLSYEDTIGDLFGSTIGATFASIWFINSGNRRKKQVT